MSIKSRRLAIAGLFYATLIAAASAVTAVAAETTAPRSAPKVVVSLQPLHALVAAVMQGVGEPQLLLQAASSPHTLHLRPSQMRALSDAEVVFWFGEPLERALAKPILAVDGLRSEPLLQSAELALRLGLRGGGVWDGDKGHDHNHRHDSAGLDLDPHVWLDPRNAQALAARIGAVLSEVDPQHRSIYQDNLGQIQQRLVELEDSLRQQLAAVRDIPYVVFHDAYQYFERRFELSPAGSLTLDPGRQPGAKRVQQIRDEIERRGARCVFSEPQFRPPLVAVLTEGGAVGRGELDPLGVTLTPGPDSYFELLNNLAAALVDCLAG